MIRLLVIAVAVVLASWLVLIFLATRLPEGLAKDLAAFLPSCVTLLRRLRTDPRVPRRAKLVLVCVAIYVVLPIDLIPDFVPVIGVLDDAVIVALALRYAGRQVPRSVISEAWPGDPALINRLLGPERA
jgi:uncharacterized membrane protein YkvA (DUF1232 family)